MRLRAPNHPHLDGVAVGNLVVGALIQRSGDIHAASRELATLLESRVEVLPVSIEHVQLAAVLSGGDTVRGESRVRALGQPPIEHVFLENEISGVSPGAAAALAGADAVIVGPGALWTSLAATLATKGVREALAPSARILYVCNTTTQPGQTDGLGATDHVAIVAKYLGRAPDVVLLNRAEPPPRLGEALRRDGLCPLPVTPEEIARIETNGSKVVLADLLASVSVRPELWKKQDTAYHDMPLTAATLLPHITRCPPE